MSYNWKRYQFHGANLKNIFVGDKKVSSGKAMEHTVNLVIFGLAECSKKTKRKKVKRRPCG